MAILMQRLHDAHALSAAAAPPEEEPIFSAAGLRRQRYLGPGAVSIVVHVMVAAALVLVPILLPEALIETPQTDVFRVLIYDPPPPPPPPLPKGSSDGGRRPMAAPSPPTPQPAPVTAEAPFEAPLEAAAPSPPTVALDERAGSPTGSDSGVPEGMEEGVEGEWSAGCPVASSEA